jgi:hypothetical protein
MRWITPRSSTRGATPATDDLSLETVLAVTPPASAGYRGALAQVGHAGMSALTPLLGAKQTSRTIIRARAKERRFLIRAEGSGLAIQRSDGGISAHVFRDGFPVHEISPFAVGQRDYDAGRFSIVSEPNREGRWFLICCSARHVPP